MTEPESKPIEASPETPAPPPESVTEAPVATGQPEEAGPPAQPGLHWGTGRRKTAVARVRLVTGTGQFVVNKRPVENYFTELQDRADVVAPLELTGVRRYWDVKVNVRGGGRTGQAGAIRLGVARALLKAYSQFEQSLRDAGYLTRDAREVERKKYGQRKARRRFQFSKR